MRLRLLLLAAAVCVAATSHPTRSSVPATWYQSLEKIFLEVNADCTTQREVSMTNDTFSLSCDTATGPAAYSFTLREPIVASESACVPTAGKELCTLLKREPHQFDRLTREPNELGTQLVSDWTKWNNHEEHGLDAFDDYENVDFPRWEMSEYIMNTANNDVSIIDADLPWCTKCM
jgi:hypothetical protein